VSTLCLRRITLALLVTICGAIAAVFAHLAIDGFGDVLLSHDAYDGVAHDSRAVVVVLALGLLACGIGRFLIAHVQRPTLSRLAIRAQLRALVPCSRRQFVLLVIVATSVLLVGMEAADTVAAGAWPDDLRELIGGSFSLCLSAIVLCAVGVAATVRECCSWLARSESLFVALARFIGSLPIRPPAIYYGVHSSDVVPRRTLAFARSDGQRGRPFCARLFPRFFSNVRISCCRLERARFAPPLFFSRSPDRRVPTGT
jgi:hypothetical protein